jgi:hypothetical protein
MNQFKSKMKTGALSIGFAAAVAVASLTPAVAASKGKHAKATAQYSQSQRIYASERGMYSDQIMAYSPFAPFTCWTDDGYGRWSSCDIGQ